MLLRPPCSACITRKSVRHLIVLRITNNAKVQHTTKVENEQHTQTHQEGRTGNENTIMVIFTKTRSKHESCK